MSGREEQLKAVIRQMLRPLRDIPLDIIIEAITERYTIWPYDGHALACLEAIAARALAAINAHGIVSKRANEVGNKCEPFVRRAIMDEGGTADTPAAPSGQRRAAGYPDIEAVIEDKPFYIEVKSYNARNVETTQRSFYLSPSTDFKVTRDAYHLIFAFCINDPEEVNGSRIYRASSYTIIDARNLSCDVKFESNSDNRRLCGAPEMIVARIDA
ncbi:MAG TPA: hypothetical protein ENK15_04145 [Thermopetrobacter sp.]|nr:hypothetical protein [Thermopetrobacter sp.]